MSWCQRGLTYFDLCVFVQVQSIENKLDLLLSFYSQCLKKGSSNFTLSTLLDPDLTSDYQSPTDQRDLFPSANTLNISMSESGNLEWQRDERSWGCWNTNPLQLRLPAALTPSSLTLLSSTRFISCLSGMFFSFYPSIPSSLFLTWMCFQRPPDGPTWQGASAKATHCTLSARRDEDRGGEDTWTTMTWLLNHFPSPLSPLAIYLCLRLSFNCRYSDT